MAYGKLKVDRIESSAEELTLPTSAGSVGQVLTTDGSGVLSFATSTASTDLSVTANSTSLTVESSSGSNVTLPQATSSSWGVMSDEDKAKLDLIEGSATGDQTDAEIRAAVGAATDSNIFTDADHLKLDGIEASAEANQTGAEIKTAYEAESDTNAFTDADHTKLDGISASANNYAISADLLDEDDFASDSATKAASQQSIKAYVDTEVADLVDSAPSSLDTLNELAAALGDDSNYAATITTSLGLKAPKASPAFTGDATCTGTISDAKGNVRSIPQNTQGSTYTLVAADAGKHILASGTITIPDSIFSAGDAVTIINDTASDLTITKTITTMYNTADDGDSDDRTLATRGMATILFASGTVAYISGAGLS